MATVTLTFTAEDLVRLIDAFCCRDDYDNNKLEGETRGQFASRAHRNMLKRVVKSYEMRVASDAIVIDEINIS